ncbi:hypothetical protein B296_00033150 [Ensete ventricosum]|uniref:GH18 domain-containing protein n=1 Tax=Ensete ventricosum TaxID=4639 RepID=A0A426YXP1_ENSVE|nr:hypothetical protein B296_00033150 [Ensete ventricosum]
MCQSSVSSLLFSLLMISAFLHSECLQHCETGPDQVRAGYWFSQYDHYSPVSSINASLYTHLYYYSLSLDDATSSAAVTVPPRPGQLPILNTFSSTIKSSNPSLKTLLSIATEDRKNSASNAAFSAMAADPDLRASFISSALALARENAFDGLDLAWQFPSLPSDMTNLGTLLAECRARISKEAQNSSSVLLTVTVYFSNHLFEESTDDLDYPVDVISESVDWVNALCFGYHKNSNATTNNAALFDKASHFSTRYGITSWLDAGIPPCKLVMGVPAYGRSWFLKNKVKNEPGAPVVAAGPRQKMSNQTGTMAYSEIEELLRDPSSEFIYDNQTVISYFHSGGLWVSFDSPEVVECKIKFARHNRLLGYFLWPISFDDLHHTISRQGECLRTSFLVSSSVLSKLNPIPDAASDVWLRNYRSSSYKDDDGLEQAESPLDAPQEDAPTPSASPSGCTNSINNYHLGLYLSLCFLFI